MTVILCGVAADTGNVDPVPPVAADGRFEYVPIPEKGPTTESATYGSLARRQDEGVLADCIDRIRPGSEGKWLDSPAAIRDQPVHRDPNFEALTYGEHRPAYVATLGTVEPGDAVAFYGGFPTPTSPYKHRYLLGWFTVASEPTVLEPDRPREEKAALLADHPANAHAKRFAAHGDCYYHDRALSGRREDVVIVDGQPPGGLLDRAIRLSDRRERANYYMDATVANALQPVARTDGPVHLGGFKPVIHCACSVEDLREFVEMRANRLP